MSNPTWMRWIIVASAVGLLAAGCGDSKDPKDKDEEDFGDPCDQANPHFDDLDCDGDGLSNAYEISFAAENANAPYKLDWLHPDVDGNAVLDGEDDWDDDGLPNRAEAALGFDPFNPKTPVSDAVESEILDGLRDTDGDGATNMAEAWMANPVPKEGAVNRLWNPAVAGDAGLFQCDPELAEEGEEPALFKDMNFRFTSLQLTRPSTLGGILNGIMGPDIDSHELNIIAPVANFEFGTCVSYFELSAGGANCVGGEEGGPCDSYEMIDLSSLDESEAGFDLSTLNDEPIRAVVVMRSPTEAYFQTVEPLEMVFPGTLPGGGRFYLHLSHIFAAGNLTLNTETGEVTLRAFIDGAIPDEAAENTWIRLGEDREPIKLSQFLNVANPLRLPTKVGEASLEAGRHLRAEFGAVTVVVAESGD